MTTDITWKRLRKLVKTRDKGICYYCGIFDDDGHCDHRVPLVKGGTDEITNLVWSCIKCNLRKRDKLPEEFEEEILVVTEDKEEETERLSPNDFEFGYLLKEIRQALIKWLISPCPDPPDLSLYPDKEQAEEIKQKWIQIFERMERQKIRNWLRFRIYQRETVVAYINYKFYTEKHFVEYLGLATTWEHGNDKKLLQQLVDCGQVIYEEIIDPATEKSLGMFYNRTYNSCEAFGYVSYNSMPQSYIPGQLFQLKQKTI